VNDPSSFDAATTTASDAATAVLVEVALDKIKKPQRRIVVFENINLGIENGGLLNDLWTPN
jgi:hypothetical protein